MSKGTCLILSVLLAAPSVATAAEQIAVPEVSTSGVDKNIAALVTELILEALLNRHGVRALGPSDVKDMLDVEQQKMLLGCDQNSCMAELAGAMGASRVIAGMVGRLGSLYVVTLKLVDSSSAQVIARASRRFEKVEQVPEAVGPLVDDLLSAKPRNVTTSPILDLGKPKAPVETMLVRDFCKVAKRYAEDLETIAYGPKIVKDRQAILEDALHTPFLKQFDEKVGCLRGQGGRLTSKLFREMYSAKTKDVADDRRLRILEWREMDRLVELLVEAYHVGFEKEKNGAGARPSTLPFRISSRKIEPPEDTEEVRRFLDDYESAQQVLGKALVAGVKGQEKQFRKFWTPDDPKRSRTSIGYVFKSVNGYKGNGYSVEPCPIFILASSEIEKSAEKYKKSGNLEGCFRRMKDDYVTTDRVELRNPSGSKWLVERW